MEVRRSVFLKKNFAFDEFFWLSDDAYLTDVAENKERSSLNSSKDPLKSRKIIVFRSFIVTLFSSCFNGAKKFSISKLFREGSVVVVTFIRKNFQTRLEWRTCTEYLLASGILSPGNSISRINEMTKTTNRLFFSHTFFL